VPAGEVVYSNKPDDMATLLAAGCQPVAVVAGKSPAGRNLGLRVRLRLRAAGGGRRRTAGVLRAGGPRGGTSARGPPGSGAIRTGAFLHARRSDGGPERLVGIVFLERIVPSDGTRRLEVNALTWSPATWETGSKLQLKGLTTLVFPHVDARTVRVFAGQVDPADPARFSVPYEVDGHRGTIAAWLTGSDTVKMEVRDGPDAGRAVEEEPAQ